MIEEITLTEWEHRSIQKLLGESRDTKSKATELLEITRRNLEVVSAELQSSQLHERKVVKNLSEALDELGLCKSRLECRNEEYQNAILVKMDYITFQSNLYNRAMADVHQLTQRLERLQAKMKEDLAILEQASSSVVGSGATINYTVEEQWAEQGSTKDQTGKVKGMKRSRSSEYKETYSRR